MTRTHLSDEASLPLDAEAIRELGANIPPILLLVKFTDSKHVESLRQGKLWMSKLAFFQQLEESAPAGQRDKDEGLFAYHQPDQIRISINGHDVGRVLSPLAIRQVLPPSFIFCATAVTRESLVKGGGCHTVPADMRVFGDTAVVVHDVEEFKRRIVVALSDDRYGSIRAFPGHKIVDGTVQYVPRTYHGDMGPFRKFEEYAYQSEWRIALIDESAQGQQRSFQLEIGDLTDITTVLRSEELGPVSLSEITGSSALAITQ
jgi:hypothetical protein